MQTVTVASMEEISDLLVQAETDIQLFNQQRNESDTPASAEEIVKLICKIAKVIIFLLKIVKIFVGRREKKSIDMIVTFLEATCPND